MNEPIMMPLDQITRDAGTQMRVELREDKIEEYGEIIDRLQPSHVVSDGTTHWLVDGFHRWEVYRRAAHTEMPVVVTQGTLREAIREAARANGTHGLPRTAADKRRAVAAVLADAEWTTWSDRTIAEMCEVSHQLVGKVRKGLAGCETSDSDESTIRTFTTRHGTVATMNTANIGRADVPKPWAEFEVRVRYVIAGLKLAKMQILAAVEYDYHTRTAKNKWAAYFSYSRIVAPIDALCRELEESLPVEISDRTPWGYVNRKQRDIVKAIEAKTIEAAA